MSTNLFLCNLSDIFSIYPKIFRELVASQDYYDQIYLPSDADWQHKMYLMLLEVQRNINEAIERGKNYEDVIRQVEKPVFDSTHIQRFSPSSSPLNNLSSELKKCSALHPKIQGHKKTKVLWSIDDICKAALLLMRPSQKVIFENEHDMRKVYSLLYDVFRYKSVLQNALNDVEYFEQYPAHSYNESVAWLMLYDLHEREFCKRSLECAQRQNTLFEEYKIKDIADTLWSFRTRLAASISRMRIKYGALQLSQLLPKHLQNEKVIKAVTNPIVTGWINPFLIRDKDAAESLLLQFGFMPSESDTELETNQYKWDNVCPLFLSCIPANRRNFADSEFVVKNYFIIQDRSFSMGPAVMTRLLNFFDVGGDIVQTNINSPRSTAYLASLFYSVNKINNFYVYGSGSNLQCFRNYMEDLSIYNVRLFAESFTSFPLESSRFRTVVGVFANPPNSFSAILDPIDFICSRGGDLGMLEMLTEPSLSEDGKKRARLVLEQQLLTLQMAMSRSQVQFLLYETHSVVRSENQEMVEHAIKTFNETALKKHRNTYLEMKGLEVPEEAEYKSRASAGSNFDSLAKQKSLVDINSSAEVKSSREKDDDFGDCKEVKLPEIDEFIRVDLPDLCKNQDQCLQNRNNGCFLSLIRRKQITRLNAKYLIQTAEKRGLFGKPERSETIKPKPVKPQEERSKVDVGENVKKILPHNDISVARLEAATEASTFRSNLDKCSRKGEPIRFNYKKRICSRPGILFKRKVKFLWKNALKVFRSKNGHLVSRNTRKRKLKPIVWKKLNFPVHFLNIYF